LKAAVLNAPHWLHSENNRAPFVAGNSPRHLNLVVCDDELDRSPALDLLQQLAASRPLLDVVSTTGAHGGRFEIAADGSSIDYSFKDGHGMTTFVYGDWWRRVAPEQPAEVALPAHVLEHRLFMAHEASRRDWIDGLVIPFPRDLAQRWSQVWIQAPVLSEDAAVALAGLHLRAHGDFTLDWDHGASIHESPDRFYRIAASALLPGVALWLSAAMTEWRATGEPTLFGLADATVVRLGRALKARDYLHVRARAPNRDEAWADVLFFFESMLLCLQGSLDAGARFLHVSYGLPGSQRRANWGNKKWRDALDASNAPTSAFDNDRLWRLDALVGELRNSIHGEVLSHELMQANDAGESPTFVGFMRAGIALEPKLAEPIIAAAEAEGGSLRWLPQAFPDGIALIDPWSYAERAITTVGTALRSIIDAVNANSHPAADIAPAFESMWTGTETSRVNAAALVGVEQLPLV